ncbi:hypothetical protein F5X96DRAFT_653932 [Biscogniauxia mediterranea]|nr:hypothetical protein F5X96DRAFT_653932 [Biscogniauxia mediterranea]
MASLASCSPTHMAPVTAMPSIWQRHRDLFRQLYVVERKTLRDIKKTMEEEHGFPQTPLSTYESKLRVELGLRKKLKAADWVAIKNYIESMGNTPCDVYFHGHLVPRAKAKKEIARNKTKLANRTSGKCCSTLFHYNLSFFFKC